MGSCQSTAASGGDAVATPQEQHKNDLENVTIGTAENDISTRSTASRNNTSANPKSVNLRHSSSIGLDTMADERKHDGHLVSNMVNIESVRSIEQVYDGVHNGKQLGEGVAGVVRLVKHKATGIPYAVKILDLNRLLVGTSHEAQQEALRNEIITMAQLDHPNIARLQEVFEDDSKIYLVQEFGSGGELFDCLDEQPDYHYTEVQAVGLVHQMLSALRYIHAKGIIHRDLKLENFIFSTERHAELKMIDFGLSKHFDAGEMLHDAVGTPYTVAPEVIRGNYDEKCDLWAIGVIAFMLLSGETPFGGCGGPEPLIQVRSNIIAGSFEFEPTEVWANVSMEAKDFIKKLLLVDPKSRPNAEEAQQHPWIRSYHEKIIREATVNANVVKALVLFKDLPLTKRLMFEVISFTMLQDQIKDIRIDFEKMDTDGLGEISLDDMNLVLTRSSHGDAASGGHEALSEAEIKQIFDSVKVGKSETRVRWHEFVAACLPECGVDERNLRIAFERMDRNHNGFITFEEVIQLIARDANENEEVLLKTWTESVEEYHCQKSQFSYQEFCRLVHAFV